MKKQIFYAMFVCVTMLVNLKLIAQKELNPMLQTSTIYQAKIMDSWTSASNIKTTVPANSNVTLTKYMSLGYWEASYNGIIGYISDFYLKMTPEMSATIFQNPYYSACFAYLRGADSTAENMKIKSLYDKYESDKVLRILNHQIWIGMSSEQAKESIGNPTEIKSNTNAYGRTEQWIYPHEMYIYFDNGILTTIQD